MNNFLFWLPITLHFIFLYNYLVVLLEGHIFLLINLCILNTSSLDNVFDSVF